MSQGIAREIRLHAESSGFFACAGIEYGQTFCSLSGPLGVLAEIATGRFAKRELAVRVGFVRGDAVARRLVWRWCGHVDWIFVFGGRAVVASFGFNGGSLTAFIA